MHRFRRPARVLGKLFAELFYLSYASGVHLWRRRSPHQFIFVVSHMRSGSTLLTHLLASHPEVCGYGETHSRYYARANLRALVGKVLYTLRGRSLTGNERYVLDKVLHDRLISPRHLDLLCSDDVKVIFLLREARATLASTIQSLGYTESRALDYYLKRVTTLADTALALSPRTLCAGLTYDQLLYRTEDVLRLLQRFLDLDAPLEESYRLFPTTGRRMIGDSSPAIRTGRIVKPEGKPTVALSDESVRLGNQAYERCQAVLNRTCATIEGNGSAGEHSIRRDGHERT